MSTPLRRTGSLGNTGKKVVAALNFPSGLSAGTGTTVTGGTVSGTTTISPGATQIFVGMTESPAGSGQFGLSADIGGTLLPDTTTLAYTVEARQVADATDMTTYSAIASAFAAATLEIVTEEPVTYGGGFLKSGGWGASLPNGNQVITIGTSSGQIQPDGSGNVPANLSTNAKAALLKTLYGSTGSVWVVDPIHGNDANSGTWDSPFATLLPACTGGAHVASAGDVILHLPGTSNNGTASADIPHGVSLIGLGIDVSVIQSSCVQSTNGAAVVPGNNSQIRDITITFAPGTNTGTAPIGTLYAGVLTQKASSGVTFTRVKAVGDIDGWHINHTSGPGGCVWTLIDCIGITSGDVIATSTGTSPNLVTIKGNTILTGDPGYAAFSGVANKASVRGIATGIGDTIRMYGGSIRTQNATSSNVCVYNIDLTSTTELYGVALGHSGTGSDIDNSQTGVMNVWNCDYNTTSVSGSITNNYPNPAKVTAFATNIYAPLDFSTIKQATGATMLNNISLGGNVAGSVGSVSGDVAGKVLGGGTSTIVGVGTNANMVLANGQTFLLLPNGSSSGAGGTVAIFNKEEVTGYANYPFDQGFNGGVDLTGWGEMLFMVKARKQDADTAALVQVKVTNGGSASDGLLLLNGAAPVSPITAADGNFNTISVTGGTTPAFSFNIHLSAPAMAQLPDGGTFFWEWAWWKGGDKQAYQGTGIFKMGQTIIDSPTQP